MPHYPTTIPEICAAFADAGYPELAQRIAYFASDEDLEEGDVPVTLESALGFWELFNKVAPKDGLGRLDLACSPEGHLSANWEFCDGSGATVWFTAIETTTFAVQDTGGKFVKVSGRNSCNRAQLLVRLVDAGLFEWRPETLKGMSLESSTT